MAKIIVYYAHPGQDHSRVNSAIQKAIQHVDCVTHVDLYHEYPRYAVDVDVEQQRLVDHDVIVFQFPLLWYSIPPLVKVWIDLVLEYGFAYGPSGKKLANKSLLLALTAGGRAVDYSAKGAQKFPLRTFLSPLEQTANLTSMNFLSPYVLYGSLSATTAEIDQHAQGFVRLLESIRDDALSIPSLMQLSILHHDTLPRSERA